MGDGCGGQVERNACIRANQAKVTDFSDGWHVDILHTATSCRLWEYQYTTSYDTCRRLARPNRYDTAGVERLDRVVARLDMVDIDSVGNTFQHQDAVHIGMQGRHLTQGVAVALEQPVVSRIEAHQGHEQAQIALGQRLTEEITSPIVKSRFECVELGENLGVGFLVGLLAGSEAGLVNAVVEIAIDVLAQRIDLGGKRLGVEIRPLIDKLRESAIEHAHNIGRFIVDDGAALLVPQYRHRGAAGDLRIGAAIELMQVTRTVQVIFISTGEVAKLPALLGQLRVHHADADQLLQPLELAHHQGA